jgi:hypothetical protein
MSATTSKNTHAKASCLPANTGIQRERTWCAAILLSRLTGESLGLVGGDRSEVLQIRLVSNKHDDNVLVGVIPQLLEPSRDVLIGPVLGDIVHEQSAYGSSVVGRGDCSVSLLSGCRVSISEQECGYDCRDGDGGVENEEEEY